MGSFAGEQRWAESLGLLREVVRQELVSRQLSELLTARNANAARVLDVGCGQGTQALTLARAGHHVTGLDVSTDLLARLELTLQGEPPEVRASAVPAQWTGNQDCHPDICRGDPGHCDDERPR